MTSIRERLVQVEADFLTALSNDDVQALDVSHTSLRILSHDLHQAILSHSLDEETIEMANTTTSRISIICGGILGVYTDDITRTLQSKLDHELTMLSLREVPSRPVQASLHSSVASSPRSSDDSPSLAATLPSTSYIAPAFKWLLQNLHDPYPSNEVKQSIASSAGTDVRHINTWFMNIRRRIGWTTISRKHFAGSRTETVDAAYRVLVAEDPERPLESDIRLEFIQMEANAECFYSDKYGKNSLGTNLGVAVKTPMERNHVAHESTQASAGEDQCERRQEARAPSFVNNQASARPRSSQSSSHQSPSPTAEPRLSTPYLELGDANFPPRDLVGGRKRRFSSGSDDSDESFRGCYNQPNKRIRFVLTAAMNAQR